MVPDSYIDENMVSVEQDRVQVRGGTCGLPMFDVEWRGGKLPIKVRRKVDVAM